MWGTPLVSVSLQPVTFDLSGTAKNGGGLQRCEERDAHVQLGRRISTRKSSHQTSWSLPPFLAEAV